MLPLCCMSSEQSGHLQLKIKVYFKQIATVFSSLLSQGHLPRYCLGLNDCVAILFNYFAVCVDSMDTCLSNRIFQCLSSMYVAIFIDQHAENTCKRTWKR